MVNYDKKTGEYIFYDCSTESPAGRRSFCYDSEALNKRKEHKPKDSAIGMAADIGIELLNEEEYRELQKLENFDTKTSSWKNPLSKLENWEALSSLIFATAMFLFIITEQNLTTLPERFAAHYESKFH